MVLRIGELAKLFGTTVRVIRHCHAKGILDEPPHDPSGYRRYGAAELVQLLRIRTLRELGVPLETARSLQTASLRSSLDS